MSILYPYKVNSYRRICDVCGRPRQIEDIRFQDGVAICSIHREYRTAQQLDRINSRVRPPRLLPVPHPKPLAPIDTWTAEEAQIFNFVTGATPHETVNVTANSGAISTARSALALGWSLIYLTALLEENKRPAAWMTRARAVATTLADLIPAQQQASANRGAQLAGAVESTLSVPFSHVFYAVDTALICAGLCRLYTLTGTYGYLKAAIDAAGFLTYLQSPDLNLVTSQVTKAYGPPATSWDDGHGEFGAGLYPGDLVCLWALSLLKALAGDITIGLTAAVPSVTTAATSRTISAAMAQIRGFWTTGYGGVNGFSASTPFDHFDNTSAAAWAGTTLTSASWARGLFALTEVDGVSSQVLALWNYLQGYSSNASLVGTYSPKLALATQLDAVHARNATAFYDWSTSGLMAKIQVSRDRASVKTAKDTIGTPRPRFDEATPRSGDYLYLGPLGISTLALAPYTATGQRQESVSRACQVGLLYRQQPQGFTGQGH